MPEEKELDDAGLLIHPLVEKVLRREDEPADAWRPRVKDGGADVRCHLEQRLLVRELFLESPGVDVVGRHPVEGFEETLSALGVYSIAHFIRDGAP